jgi:hypothetical protein
MLLHSCFYEKNRKKARKSAKMGKMQGLFCMDFVCGAAMHKITGQNQVYFDMKCSDITHT